MHLFHLWLLCSVDLLILVFKRFCHFNWFCCSNAGACSLLITLNNNIVQLLLHPFVLMVLSFLFSYFIFVISFTPSFIKYEKIIPSNQNKNILNTKKYKDTYCFNHSLNKKHFLLSCFVVCLLINQCLHICIHLVPSCNTRTPLRGSLTKRGSLNS